MKTFQDHPDVWGKLLRAAAQLALIYAEKLDPTEESKSVTRT